MALLPAARSPRRQVLPRLLIVQGRKGGRGVGQGLRGWPSGRSMVSESLACRCWCLGLLLLSKAALVSLRSGIPPERRGMWATRRWARRKGLKCRLCGEGGGHGGRGPKGEESRNKSPQFAKSRPAARETRVPPQGQEDPSKELSPCGATAEPVLWSPGP